MIVADTSGLLALFNDREPQHRAVRDAVRSARTALIVSPYVVAELDHLVATRIGVDAELAVLRELAGPGYTLAALDAEDLTTAAEVIEKYADQAIGVTDASLVVLADRQRTNRVLTLDRRHFTALRSLSGEPFTLLP